MTARRLDDFRTGARRLSDMEDDGGFVADAELNNYVNEGIADLHDVRIDADDSKLLASNGPLLVTAGGDSDKHAWTLPSDFNRLISLHITQSGQAHPCISADPSEYVYWAANPPAKTAARYYLREEFGTNTKELYLFPSALTANTIAYTYVKNPPVLSLDSDTFAGAHDHLEYIETYAAAKCLSKEESDTTALEFRKEQLKKRIINATKDVDMSTPRLVRMNRRRGVGYRRGGRL